MCATLDSQYVWFLIIVRGIGTFLVQLSFIQLFSYVDEVPDSLLKALELVPIAIVAALVVPRLVFLD